MAKKKTTAVAVVDESALDASVDSYLRAQSIVDAINAAKPDTLAPIPKGYIFRRRDKEVVSAAFHACFELIGGVPQMAAWGMSNQTQFYNLYAKLLPSNTETPVGATTINIVSSVPKSTLDNVSLNADGDVIDIDLSDVPE